MSRSAILVRARGGGKAAARRRSPGHDLSCGERGGDDAWTKWATAIADDESGDPRAEVVERTRPDAAVDHCITPAGEELSGFGIYDEANSCTDAYPVSDSPRTVAGAPQRNDVVECRLQSVSDGADVYEVTLTAEQQNRLEAVFADGVCDYDEPSVGDVDLAGTWLSYPRD